MKRIHDRAPMRICRGCGCTDDRACRGEGVAGRWFTCCWVLLDFEIRDHYAVKPHGNALASFLTLHVVPLPSGVCSRCADECDWDPAIMAGMICQEAAAVLGAGY